MVRKRVRKHKFKPRRTYGLLRYKYNQPENPPKISSLEPPPTHGRGKLLPRGRAARKRKRKYFGIERENVWNKPTIRRLARRGGVKRLSITGRGSYLATTVQQAGEKFVEELVKKAITLTEGRGKKTVTASDVVRGMKMSGLTYYN
jgi:histone H4